MTQPTDPKLRSGRISINGGPWIPLTAGTPTNPAWQGRLTLNGWEFKEDDGDWHPLTPDEPDE